MTTYSWFANSAALQILQGATAVSIAALKGVTITPRFEIVDLYGMESVLRQAVVKHSMKVDIECKYAMWDPDTDSIMAGVLMGNAAATTNPATVDDTATYRNTLGLFTITATIKDTTLAKTLTATAWEVYFDSVPYEFNENEFMVRNLKGTAKSFSLYHA